MGGAFLVGPLTRVASRVRAVRAHSSARAGAVALLFSRDRGLISAALPLISHIYLKNNLTPFGSAKGRENGQCGTLTRH